MRCKKCNLEIDDKSIFCSYCGERVEEKSDYVDPFAAYRQNGSHEAQYQYQQEYSGKTGKDDFSVAKESGLLSPKSYTLVGIILSIASVFACFFHIGIGMILLVISICLIVCGFRYAKTRSRVVSVIICIFSIVMTLIVSLLIWVSSFTIYLDNGMKYTVKEYLLSIFFNSFYSDKVYGIWQSSSGEVLDLTSNFYYRFYDENGKLQFEGSYTRIEGHDIGGSELVYSDQDFYFFDFNDIRGAFTEYKQMVLCLDKDDFSRMVLYFPEENFSVEMKRLSSLPFPSASEEEDFPIITAAPVVIG